jgi:hypothetical protein
LQFAHFFRTFSRMKTKRAANGLRHLRRSRLDIPGWVAVY